MVYDYFDKLTILCEMYEEVSDTIHELTLNFFPFDNSVQVVDPKKNKVLVRRVQLPTLKLEMLQIGNIVNVFSKLLLITNYAPITTKTFFRNLESTFAIIKPMPSSEFGKIINFILKKGFRITQMKVGKLDKDIATILYKRIEGNSLLPTIIDYVISSDVVGLELEKQNALQDWKTILGATDPKLAAPGTLRRLYGLDILRNTAHGCDSREEAQRMKNLFFGKVNGKHRVEFRSTCENCTCCIVKPHAVIDGNLGLILEDISATGKFEITGMAMFSLKVCNAKEFLEVYKGVVPEYADMALQLAEGKCVALEVKCKDPSLNVVCEFRKLCGPRDPEVCRQLYPDTIRARYGKDIVHNAVHCTDLPEDGAAEVEYFFQILTTL